MIRVQIKRMQVKIDVGGKKEEKYKNKVERR